MPAAAPRSTPSPRPSEPATHLRVRVDGETIEGTIDDDWETITIGELTEAAVAIRDSGGSVTLSATDETLGDRAGPGRPRSHPDQRRALHGGSLLDSVSGQVAKSLPGPDRAFSCDLQNAARTSTPTFQCSGIHRADTADPETP